MISTSRFSADFAIGSEESGERRQQAPLTSPRPVIVEDDVEEVERASGPAVESFDIQAMGRCP